MSDKSVSLPEGGEGCRLSFDVQAMEHLYELYGDDYVSRVLTGLDRNNVAVFKSAIEAMGRGLKKSASEVIDACTLSDLAIRIADAMYLKLHGRTFTDQQQASVTAAIAGANPDADES